MLLQVSKWNGRRRMFALASRGRFYERMHRFTHRGFSHMDALQGMWQRMQRKKDSRSYVFQRFLEGLKEGTDFSVLIGKHIPPSELLMISSGELTGAPAEGFRLAKYVADSVSRMRGAVMGALFKPAIALAVLSMLLIMVAVKVMPIMETMAPLEKWPPISSSLHALCWFLVNWGWAVLLAMVTIGVVVARTLPSWTGRVRSALDGFMPPWWVYRVYQGATFLISLSALIAAGRPLEEALMAINRIAPPWLRSHVLKMIMRAREGADPAKALDTKLLPDEVIGDIEDYSRASAFEGAVAAIGEHAVEDTIKRLEMLSFVASVVLMMLVGFFIVWVWMAMAFLSMSIASGIQQPNMG